MPKHESIYLYFNFPLKGVKVFRLNGVFYPSSDLANQKFKGLL